jgi:peroxiredoxin
MKKIMIALLLFFATWGVKSQEVKTVEQANGLKVGHKAPVFSAMDADSNVFQLKEALQNGPVVIIFYRGFWCPVCNKHLGSLQDSLRLIENTGAKVIAISPEKPEYLDVMAEKTGAQFTLLYDEEYRIAKAYDVAYKPTRSQLFTYNVVLGGKLKKTHSDASQQLPIPATFIVNRDGIIVWRQFNRDYKKRASVKDIVDALKENKETSSPL